VFVSTHEKEVVMNTRVTLFMVVVATAVVLCTPQMADAQVDWTHHGIVVTPGTWNSTRTVPGDVVFDGTEYHLYLIGGPGWNPFAQQWAVGHWTASDIQGPWDPDPCNPVLEPEPGAWDAFSIGHIAVIYDNGLFRMWYAGTAVSDGQAYAGYATNVTGDCYWTKYAGNPLAGLEPGLPGEWDENGVWPSSVLYDGNLYHMWFTTGSGILGEWYIGYATSNDGLDWSKHTTPVLRPTQAWEGNRVYAPEVLPVGDGFGMWYSGWLVGDRLQIGYAISPDGIAWGKWPDNPVLSPLPGTDVGDSATVILEGNTFHGWVGHHVDVAYATSPFEVLQFDGFESGDTTIWGGIAK
jgi:hypothetical protein